ncbi:MAG: glycosyltransferase [Pseudomonadota bacterium]
MKKILFLTHQLPYPPVSGGAIKRWKLVEYLSENYDLAISLLYSDGSSRLKDTLLSKIRITDFYGETLNRPRTIRNLLKSYLKNIPLLLYRNYSATFKKHVENICTHYDIIFLDSLIMSQYVPENFSGRIILHAHNAEYMIWEKLFCLERHPVKKLGIFLESKRIKTYEKAAGNKAHCILAAPNDRIDLMKLGIKHEKFYETFHLGDEGLLNQPGLDFDRTEKALLYIGTLSWEPNVDGLIWFIKHAWDRLKAKNPLIRFYIVGENPGKKLQTLVRSKKDIVLTGFVADPAPYYARCRIFVAPLRFGGGIKVKIINAMYRGIPIVTTQTGTEGLLLKDRVHAAISEDLNKMVSDIHLLLRDKALWKALQNNARCLARQEYMWNKVFLNIDKAIQGD